MRIFPNDTFITSFPKSGNTWVRFFIANLLDTSGHVDFKNLDFIVPDIYKVSSESLEKLEQPRFLKSHSRYNKQYATTLYLVRDVRGVVSSHYRQRLRMGKLRPGTPIREFTEAFIAGSTTKFGTWDEHVRGWIFRQGDSDRKFAFFKYEDLCVNGLNEFVRMVKFLNLSSSVDDVERAANLASFQRMRDLEQDAERDWLEKREAKNLSIPFMYSGRADSWESDLDKQSKNMLTREYGDLLSQLGYQT